MKFGRAFSLFAAVLGLLMLLSGASEAQLARSFVNVTAIRVKQLPNAVQVRIETDGSAQFGTDFDDWIDFERGFSPKPTQSLRIRVVRARAKLPAFVPLEAYPIDGAVVTLGREDFKNPYFPRGQGDENDPRVQIELRFAAPVRVQSFGAEAGQAIEFDDILGPLEASVEPSNDRRAIVITVITNRADSTAPQRLDRSPRADRKHSLSIKAGEAGRFRLRALHTPLKGVLDELASVTGTRFLAREEVANLEISVNLPDASPLELLQALQIGYGLGFRDEGGTFILGRGDEFFSTRALALQNLSPDAARLLFPDFLLPFLRSDREINALVAVQNPPLLAKIAADLQVLDAPRAQFEVTAQAWEIASTREVNLALSLSRTIGGDAQTIDFGAGAASVRVERGMTTRLSGVLNALSARGRARLVAAPSVTAVSGERGTLFLGQTLYILVIQNSGGGQSARALPLQIGTTLGVTPRGNDRDGDILLDIAPRISTVDEIEVLTGLPTLGIRESSSTIRLRDSDSVVLAGLEFDFDSRAKRRTLKLFPSRRESRDERTLLVLVTARRVPTSPTSVPAASVPSPL